MFPLKRGGDFTMSFVDAGNLTSGIDFSSIIRNALQQALGGKGLTDKAIGLPIGTAGTLPSKTVAVADAPALATSPPAPTADGRFRGFTPATFAPKGAQAPATTPAPGVYDPHNDKTYQYRYATGGKEGTSTVDASSLTNLPLEAMHAADPTKHFGEYYGAYTDQGDLAATLMAQPGAKTQLIDPNTGQVVAEGVGPQGSQEIASLASAISKKLGKQATWDIAQETGAGTGKFQTFYGDRVDKPRFTLLSALKMIAPAALGMLLGPAAGGLIGGLTGLGSAASTALGSGLTAFGTGLAEGEKPLQAAIGGLGAGAGGFLGAGGLGGAAGGAAGGSGLGFLSGLSPNFSAAAGDVGTFSPSAAAAGLGGITSGALGGGALGSVLGNGLSNPTGTLSGAVQGGGDLGANTVEGITVTAPRAAAGGIGGAAGAGAGGLAGGMTGGWSGTPENAVSPEIDVTAPKTATTGPQIDPAQIATNIPGLIPTSSYTPAPQLDQPQNNANRDSKIGQNVADLLNKLLNGGGPSGGSQGGRSTVTDPFTPGGGTSGPGDKNTGPIGGTPNAPNAPSPGTPAIHATSPSFSSTQAGGKGVTGSPFGGGAGPAALGSINLKGSAAPDIYPWQTVV